MWVNGSPCPSRAAELFPWGNGVPLGTCHDMLRVEDHIFERSVWRQCGKQEVAGVGSAGDSAAVSWKETDDSADCMRV